MRGHRLNRAVGVHGSMSEGPVAAPVSSSSAAWESGQSSTIISRATTSSLRLGRVLNEPRAIGRYPKSVKGYPQPMSRMARSRLRAPFHCDEPPAGFSARCLRYSEHRWPSGVLPQAFLLWPLSPPSAPLARRMPHWDPRALACPGTASSRSRRSNKANSALCPPMGCCVRAWDDYCPAIPSSAADFRGAGRPPCKAAGMPNTLGHPTASVPTLRNKSGENQITTSCQQRRR